ncbi:MAG: hypothetical protein A2144_02940 [Chloroflexi bacterium RBG_16_50_9]|nr:MAG: hypothetical protein A2144_02940 [Chloroflexi bacterium RBG_16_50_9]
MRIIENGKLEETGSVEIKGVTLEMMRWWIMHRTRESYKMWHHDHIDFKVLRRPERGEVGYTYIVKERFGKYLVSLKSTIEEWSDTASTVLHKTYLHPWPVPMYNLRVRLKFAATPAGLMLHSTHVVGSDNPIWGRLWNFITRKFIYTEKLRAAYARHAEEESENFPNFLKKLYAERGGDNGNIVRALDQTI